jgi:hypothetical protein
MKTATLLILATLMACTLTQATAYKPHWAQSKDQYSMDRDRTNLPFKDTLDDPNGAIIVKEFDEKDAEVNREEWDDNDREFSAEDFYTVLVPGNDTIVSISII